MELSTEWHLNGDIYSTVVFNKGEPKDSCQKVARLEIGKIVISQKCSIAQCKHSIKKKIVELNAGAPNLCRDWGRTLES